MADKTIRMVLVGEDKSAAKALKGVGDEADKAEGRLKGLGTGGALALAGAATAVAAFGASSVGAYRDAAKSQRELEDAYARFPATADVSIEKMRELNSAIQEKTGADADDLASSQAVMAQYGLTGQQLADLTPLLDDYAVKTGKDLPSAAEDLGKAMLGQGRALKDVGIDFADTGSVAGNFDQVMAGLRTQVGGFAESEVGSAEGALRKLNTEFGDVQEEVGAQLLPVLIELSGALLDVIGYVKENADWLGPLVVVLGTAAAAYAAISVAGGLYTAYMAASAAATGGLTVAQWALNAALSANPVGLVVIAIAALVAGLIVAYNESETFRNIVDGAFRAVGDAGAWLWNNALMPALKAILGGFAWVTDGLANMLDALGKIPGFGWAADAADKLRGLAEKARSAADGINKIPDSKTVNIAANTASYDRAVNSINGRTLTTYVAMKVYGQGAVATGGYGGDVAHAIGLADGGMPRSRFSGVVNGPGTTTSDSIPAWLSRKEFVTNAAATDYYGTDVMYAMNARAIPREFFGAMGFAGGGSMSRSAGSGAGLALPQSEIDRIADAVRFGAAAGTREGITERDSMQAHAIGRRR